MNSRITLVPSAIPIMPNKAAKPPKKTVGFTSLNSTIILARIRAPSR